MTFTVWHIVGASAIVAIIVAVIATIRTRQKDIKKVAYMMDALEDGELNFRFQEKNKFNRTLNRIRTIFEKQRQAHEQDSWTKLIRVLTHEIMNTVSPIASLSDAMAKSVDENGHSELDIKAGLETISDSSKNLIGFVQTYRQLSGVAKPINIRLICATNMDLEQLVREGRFREDLYYRINTVHIALPALRERKEDIVPLAQMFLERFAEKYHRPLAGIAPEAAAMLKKPG